MTTTTASAKIARWLNMADPRHRGVCNRIDQMEEGLAAFPNLPLEARVAIEDALRKEWAIAEGYAEEREREQARIAANRDAGRLAPAPSLRSDFKHNFKR